MGQSTPTFSVRLFGPCEVLVNGNLVPTPHGRTGLWLLALLILRHPSSVRRDWLAGVLWPESTQEQALANLRQRLYELRRTLGPEGRRLLAPNPRSLSIDLENSEVDLLTFDACIRCADSTALERATTLYRGPLLEGCTEEWAMAEREMREQAYLQAHEQMALCFVGAGVPANAARHFRQVIAIDPLRESAQSGLLVALAECGDYAAAVEAYREFRLLVRRELNTEPSFETTALFTRIRQRARAGTTSREPKSPIIDAPQLVQNNLPARLTSFVGRMEEKRQIRQLLITNRLITLTGAGGCGKTRLALEVGSDLLSDFEDGVWFAELASMSDSDLIPQTLASALGIAESPEMPPMQTIAENLRSKTVLIILDNCEHVAQACVTMLEILLKSCMLVKVLATSREPLRMSGEQVWSVPSLATPEETRLASANEDAAKIAGEYDSVRLFVERARAHRAEFKLTDQNARAIASICRRLDGIPLALELAAARVRAATAEQIDLRLNEGFALLSLNIRNAPPRQQTLRAMLDWSYNLLNESERLTLRKLSVFAGGFTLDAVDHICCAPPEALDVLTSLVDKSLVMFEEREGEGRYRLLETVRQYAEEKRLSEDGGEAVMERHLKYYLDIAERSAPGLIGGEARLWLDRIEAERDNLRAAFEYCLRESEQEGKRDRSIGERVQETAHSNTVLQLVNALWRYWDLRGYLTEGRAWMTAAIGVVAARPPDSASTIARILAGALAYSQRDMKSARLLLDSGLADAREIQDRKATALALHHIAALKLSGVSEHVDEDEACRLLEESLALSRELSDPHGVGSTLILLGQTAYHRLDTSSARRMLDESLAISASHGHRMNLARSLNVLGNVSWAEQELEAAQDLYLKAIEIYRELTGRGFVAALTNLGQVARLLGDFELATGSFEESLAIWRELGSRMGIAITLHHLSDAATGQRDYDAAHSMLEEALDIMNELSDHNGVLMILGCLVTNAQWRNDTEEAWRLYHQMERMGAASWGDRRLFGFTLISLGLLMRKQGNLKAARELIEQSIETLSERQGQVGACCKLILIALDQGDDHAAWEVLKECFALASNESETASVLEAAADFAGKRKQYHLSARLFGAAQAIRNLTGYKPPDAEPERGMLQTELALGDSEFASALAEGRALSIDEARGMALLLTCEC